MGPERIIVVSAIIVALFPVFDRSSEVLLREVCEWKYFIWLSAKHVTMETTYVGRGLTGLRQLNMWNEKIVGLEMNFFSQNRPFPMLERLKTKIF